jgi:hypothetical protein
MDTWDRIFAPVRILSGVRMTLPCAQLVSSDVCVALAQSVYSGL